MTDNTTPAQMTAEQRDLARHALGLPNKRQQSYRNYFVTGEGAPDHPHWVAMADAGFARRRKALRIYGGDDLFRLTKEGATAALDEGEQLDPEDFA